MVWHLIPPNYLQPGLPPSDVGKVEGLGHAAFLDHLPLVGLLLELLGELAEGHAVLLGVLVIQSHQQSPANEGDSYNLGQDYFIYLGAMV